MDFFSITCMIVYFKRGNYNNGLIQNSLDSLTYFNTFSKKKIKCLYFCYNHWIHLCNKGKYTKKIFL